MKRWSLAILGLATVVLLVAVELLGNEPPAGVSEPVRLTTRTPTVTRTVGWWTEVATWTPTPTGEGAQTLEEESAKRSTPTPELNIPPVKTVEQPTRRP